MPIMLLTAHSASREEYTRWWGHFPPALTPHFAIFCPNRPKPLFRKTLFCLYFTINPDMPLPVWQVGYFSCLFEERVTAVHNLAHSHVTADSHWPYYRQYLLLASKSLNNLPQCPPTPYQLWETLCIEQIATMLLVPSISLAEMEGRPMDEWCPFW